jgi:hypothetical protein
MGADRTKTSSSSLDNTLYKRHRDTAVSGPTPSNLAPVFSPLSTIHRKASCACGGGCPNCQAKSSDLRVSNPSDAAEIEADRIADKAMRMPEGQTASVKSDAPVSSGIHRKCPQNEHEGPVLRKTESGSGNPLNSGAASHVTSAISSGGQALDRQTRAFFEPRFGHDFSHVRIFSDENAFESARQINALAYTLGRNIVFNRNQYQPGTESGKHLIAHELAHTLQPGGPTLHRAAIHTGRILNEGSCQHLACNSKWACDDPAGVLCATGTRNAGKKMRPLFTCDVKCENGRKCGSDYIAIPSNRFKGIKGGQCGQDLVICANGHFTHGTIRDRSEKKSWEVAPGILSALGVSPDIKNGAIYPDEKDADFLTDSRCRPAVEKKDVGTSDAGTPDGGIPDEAGTAGGKTTEAEPQDGGT